MVFLLALRLRWPWLFGGMTLCQFPNPNLNTNMILYTIAMQNYTVTYVVGSSNYYSTRGIRVSVGMERFEAMGMSTRLCRSQVTLNKNGASDPGMKRLHNLLPQHYNSCYIPIYPITYQYHLSWTSFLLLVPFLPHFLPQLALGRSHCVWGWPGSLWGQQLGWI